MSKEIILKKIKNKLIVSSQAAYNEPLYLESAMNAMIDTIVQLGKINALRLAGVRDIINTRKKYKDIVIIGITKPDTIPINYKELVYITPDIKHATEIINAGADIIAFDGTIRNENVKDIIDIIHRNKKLAMADIATLDDANYSYESGCDIISTTLSGYTKETENNPDEPDFSLLEKCVKNFHIPIILEGKISNSAQIKNAFRLGAHSVVVGSIITRPHKIIEKLKEGLNE